MMGKYSYDMINAAFEAGSAVLLWLNVHRLFKDKRLSGVSVFPVAWFSLWGGWNMVYYQQLEQRCSWAAGVAVFVANSVWLVLAIYYMFRPGPERKNPLEEERLRHAVRAATYEERQQIIAYLFRHGNGAAAVGVQNAKHYPDNDYGEIS